MEKKTSNATKNIEFPEESISLNHKAFVAPSADTGENFLYESIEIRPTNGKELPDGFTLNISNREVLFPTGIKPNNKFELEGEGVERKDPWTGYDIKGDKIYTYNGGNSDYQIVKVDEKANGQPTGNFYYKIEWKTKVTKLPNNYWIYGDPGAKSKANISYTYEGQPVTSARNETISFYKIVDKPSYKAQIDQKTENGKRITTWAIVFNRDHRRKAVSEVSDTLEYGSYVKDSLNYYFIAPNKDIPTDGREIKNLLANEKANQVAKDAASAKPYYTITKDANGGKESFVIKFGDHSNTLNNKIAQIKANYPKYATDKKQAEDMNKEIIKYIFKDYVYYDGDTGTIIKSNGEYFTDTNQAITMRNFPNLSNFKTNGSPASLGVPFTALTNSFITLKKAHATDKEPLAYYRLDENMDEKSDALIITYQTESNTKPENNSFDSEWLNEFPPLSIVERNKYYNPIGPIPDDGDIYPQLNLTTIGTDNESGEQKGTNQQNDLYPAYKHSFIDTDMTLIKNGVLANIKGSYCEDVEIKDAAQIIGGTLGAYTNLKLVKFKLSDFEKEIERLKAANNGKSENEIYSIFIKNYTKGQGITGKDVSFNASDDKKTIDFKTGVTEESFRTNKEANQFVYLFTYDMDASYLFSKGAVGNASFTINNVATVTYDKGLKVNTSSSINKGDFLTKEDITPKNEPETSGVKKYRLSFDFTDYELKDIKEVKITDTFGAYDNNVEITNAAIKGALKAKTNPTDPDDYENLPQGIHLVRDGKVFTVYSDDDLSGKKFTIVYDVKMDLSKIYAGGQGEKTLNNTATAEMKNSNTPPQTIKESATASTIVQYGEFLKKTVNTWSPGATEDEIKDFKAKAKRHYTLTFNLKGKDFLKNSNTLEVEDTFGGNHGFVRYENIVIKENGSNSTNLKVKINSRGTGKIVFGVTKTSNSFPDSFTLEYDVILQNSKIVGNNSNGEVEIYNVATAKFIKDNTSYIQNATAKTQVRSGFVEAVVQNFTINLQKVIPEREIGRGKSKQADYSKVSFELKGKYTPLDTSGNPLAEKQYNSGKLTVSSDGSLIFDKIPFNGDYVLQEFVDPDSDYYGIQDLIKFNVSKDGKTITFVDSSLGAGKVEVTGINSKTYPATINEGQPDGSSREVPNPELTKLTQEVEANDAWGFVVKMGLKVYNKLKDVDKHTLIFRKVDQDKNPLQGAIFKIEKLNSDGTPEPVFSSYTSDGDGIVSFSGLDNGKYKVTETATAPGRYDGNMASFTIELTKDMAEEYDYGDVINKKLNIYDISFIKADSEKDEKGNLILLQGAEFKLMKKGSRDEFKEYATAKSGVDGKVTFNDVPAGFYKIVESKAPIGYRLPEDTTVIPEFEVKEDKDETYYNWTYEHEIITYRANRGRPIIETIKQKVVKNTKIKHSISFTKYMEAYNSDPVPMEGATFILKANDKEVKRAVSNKDGLVEFKNLDNNKYEIVEAPEDKENNINNFKDHEINATPIKVPDLTNARDKGQNIKLFTDEDKLNKDKKFVNYKVRKGFSFKKVDEALDEKGQPKVMKDVEFKAYRKVGNDFEKDVYKYLNGKLESKDFKDAISKSNEEGNVIFTGFEPGTYKIVETRVPGYQDLSFEITVSKDGVKFPKNIENGQSNIVKNSYTRHEVTFKKVDELSKVGLEGAVFKVEKLEKDGSYTLINDKVTSNAQGVVSIPRLLNGEYRITEIKAPLGYKERNVSFKFTLADTDLPQVVLMDVGNERLPDRINPKPQGPSTHVTSTQGHSTQGLLNKKDHAAYMYGYPDGSFRPKKPMTRAEVTTMFGRLLLKKYTESKEFRPIYPDVKKGDWYGSAVTIMSDLKLVKGYPDGTFKPNAPITRAEFATIASRFDKIVGGTVNFKDLNTSHWAYSYIASAYHKGWVNGYPDGTFKPEKDISREEVVAITNRMLDRKCDLDFVKLHIKELLMFYDNHETSWSYGDVIESTNGHDYHRKNNNTIDEVWERLNKKEFHI